MKRLTPIIKIVSVLFSVALLSACGGTKSIPMTVQSAPLGAHVAMQVNSSVKGTSKDWVYLGRTPLDIRRSFSRKQLNKARSFRFKMMKDGFVDQVRDWNGKEMDTEMKEKGHLYWNPKLVPSS
ncbi:MAG: hypothetical protein V3V09_04315 [Arenicellales bacterium]